jgi:DHA1 family tetracycline resistance protein-like MFS transporter
MSLPQTAPRKAALAFIMVTVLLDVLALGIIIPILPRLIVSFVHDDMAVAARYIGLFGTLWALMQFVFSPVQGALSDHFGRRPVILLSNLGLGVDYIIMALAPGLSWLLVGRILAGITAASMSTSGAYIADVTPPQDRARRFGYISAAWGIGFVVGPALGGVLGGIDPRLPFWIAAALSLTNFVYGLFVLPESLPADRRAPFSLARANPLGALGFLRAHSGLLGLAGVNALYWLAHQVLPSVFVAYTMFRYNWSETTVGLSLAASGVCTLIVQGFLVGRVVPRIGERRAIILGLLFGASGFAMFGAAASGVWLFAGIAILSLWGFYAPASQALMSRRVGASEQGQLQGANMSVMALTGLVGPCLFTLSFAHFIGRERTFLFPGAPFYLASGLLVMAALLAFRICTAMLREAESVS